MFDRHFQSLPTPAPALHDGPLSWDDIAHGSFEDFRSHYSSLNVPLSDGDRPDTLHVLWQALRTSPRRDRVQTDLQDLLTEPHSLDEFTAILHAKAGLLLWRSFRAPIQTRPKLVPRDDLRSL